VECGHLAAEHPDRTLRVREDVALLETPCCGEGQYGVVVTVLNNPAFPLLRYALGDVTDVPLRFPDRGFAVLEGGITGRANELLVSRSGRRLHPFLFDEIFEHSVPQARRWRLRQRIDGSLAVQVEQSDRPGANNGEELRNRLQSLLEGYPVTVSVTG